MKDLKKWALIFPVIDKHIVKKSSKMMNFDFFEKKSYWNELLNEKKMKNISMKVEIL